MRLRWRKTQGKLHQQRARTGLLSTIWLSSFWLCVSRASVASSWRWYLTISAACCLTRCSKARVSGGESSPAMLLSTCRNRCVAGLDKV
jgi:hypothetical protein